MLNFTQPVTITATTPAELQATIEMANTWSLGAQVALNAGGSFFGLTGDVLEEAMYEALNVANKAERRLDNMTGNSRAEAASALLGALGGVNPTEEVDMSVSISDADWLIIEASLLGG